MFRDDAGIFNDLCDRKTSPMPASPQRSSMLSAVAEKILDGQPDVAGDLAQQRRRNVAPLVHGNGGSPTVGMAILDVRTALAHRLKTQLLQQPA